MKRKMALVPTDFSAGAKAALAYALDYARQMHCQLRIVHVIDIAPIAVYGPESVPTNLELYKQLRTTAQQQLDAFVQDIPDTLMQGYEIIENVDGVAENVSQQAKTHACDIIIMGTHGRRGVQRWLLGSVAEKVARLAPCPVLLVRHTVDEK